MTKEELIANKADLRGADLREADLRCANLRGADLREADLRCANLNRADLRCANLNRAYLRGADLREADLRGANLNRADLREAYLRGANLSETCLDPNAPIPEISNEVLLSAGLLLDGEHVIGFRTSTSIHCGTASYEPGSHHIAPYFSVSDTECHPGIYLHGLDWITKNYPDLEIVKVKCLRSELHKAGDKFRAKQIWVLEGVSK